ncbi:hypothetical protein [Limnobacter sp.]|uniref:hypothetical protein n=1 Tax=Limnobacter sp. TaxID=2003368 RepID=UPI0025C1B528|nr:hypothetical protein [Limnobacter sp.]
MLDVQLCAAVRTDHDYPHPVRVQAVKPDDYVCIVMPIDGWATEIWLQVLAIHQDEAGHEYIEAIADDRFGKQDIGNGVHIALRHSNIKHIKLCNEVPHA